MAARGVAVVCMAVRQLTVYLPMVTVCARLERLDSPVTDVKMVCGMLFSLISIMHSIVQTCPKTQLGFTCTDLSKNIIRFYKPVIMDVSDLFLICEKLYVSLGVLANI